MFASRQRFGFDFGYKLPDVISLATVSLQWLHDNQLNGLVKVESFVERGCQADMLATWSLASIRSFAL